MMISLYWIISLPEVFCDAWTTRLMSAWCWLPTSCSLTQCLLQYHLTLRQPRNWHWCHFEH